MHEDDDKDELPGMERFPENNERVKRQKELPIRVIVGNPPYSVAKGTSYPTLTERIKGTYAAESSATLKKSLDDSYIQSVRWASDRIGDRGIICFVSNGGYLDGNAADGLRKHLIKEFSQISVFNLRGNTRTSGEQARREGGQTFGAGSRATIAITLLVKDPETPGPAKLFYRDIGDYLTREEKLAILTEHQDFAHLDLTEIVPNDEGDWLNQRDPAFDAYQPIGTKNGGAEGELRVFRTYSAGLKTNRDLWAYGSSGAQVENKMRRLVSTYTEAVESIRNELPMSVDDLRSAVTQDPAEIKWDGTLEDEARKAVPIDFETEAIRTSCYRPFFKQKVYFNRKLNNSVYKLPELFPTPEQDNYGFYLNGIHATSEFAALMVDEIPCLDLFGKGGQFFPRYTYVEQGKADNLLDAAEDDGSPYRRVDNITDEILADYQAAYGGEVTKDDIFFYVYGLLHSPDYRERFQADLKKMLPRIPKVSRTEDFVAFTEAGRRLSDLHIGYEAVKPWPLAVEEPASPDYRIVKLKPAKRGKEKDMSTIIYNRQITVAGIPKEAYRYMLGSRSAIEWIMDRYQVKTDKKSGITNDPNDWSEEVGDPRYILDLLGRIVRVSIETMETVDGLPELTIDEEGSR